MDDEKKLSFFFLGLGLGVAVGILFAPKSGQETRDMIRSRADEGMGYLKRRGEELRDSAGNLIDKGKDVISRQREQVVSALDAGKQAYRDVVGGGQTGTGTGGGNLGPAEGV